MSKLIAIWGCPNSGKTTLAVKLAAELHNECGMQVYTVFADDTIPALPVVFPHHKADEIYSMGTALSKVKPTQTDIEANTVTTKVLPDLGFLGYKDGENRYSYPQADELKYSAFLAVLKDMADIVIVECTSVPNQLSRIAMSQADDVIRVVTPELKSVCFCTSYLPLLGDPAYQRDNHMIILNENTNDVYAPVYDAEHFFGDTVLTIPYCHEVRLQSFNGDLLDRPKSKKFNKQLTALVHMIME